jgi:formylglycine-generating enzyme required for sulfatase activity
MGSPPGRPFSNRDERPVHAVALTRPFYLGVHEVTQGQWVEVMGFNPSREVDLRAPVDSVNYAEVMAFLASLNRQVGDGRYRLPTEAEWEYAARGGTDTDYFFGSDPEGIDRYAWHKGNSGGATHPVGQLAPNRFGLYDIIGNVYEWLADHYDEFYYEVSPLEDPSGPVDESGIRSVRGCSFDIEYHNCRSADRGSLVAHEKRPNQGFRIAYTAE